MYDLGEKFKIDLSHALSREDCIFKGDKYRITVLTERLVRLEYSDNGLFNDYPTEIAWNRNFEKPSFTVDENDAHIKISTNYFELLYSKNKPFDSGKVQPAKNLKINLKNSDKIWYYKHPEARNYNYVSNLENGKTIKSKSLYSGDGFVSIDDSNTPIILENGCIKLRENKQIDIYVFLYNKDFYFCLNDYFKLTGFPDMIPRYALGTFITKNTFYDQYSLLHSIQKYEEHGIPISSFILDNWESNSDYQFNVNFKEIDKLIKYLNDKKIKIGLNIKYTNYFKEKTDNYDLLKKYLQVDKDGKIPFNLLDPKCVDAFLKLIIHPLNSLGIGYYNIYNDKNYANLELLKYYIYKDTNKENRHMLISENSYLVPHRYSILYTGKSVVSWKSLESIPKFNNTATNMGISYWAHDFGGTTGGIEDAELYTRYIQLGAFSPILRLGSDSSKYYKREPWKWGISTSQIASYFLKLRYKLIPYIYTECYKYYKYGKPLIEPIYYRYPDLYDDVLFNDNYFFGSTFYVSPILHKKDPIMDRVIHKLYIPDGTWYEFFTGKKYTGGKRYVSFYKENEYPVFVRSGSIIPLSLNSLNDTSIPERMEIQVFPGASNTYSIYEDDGITTNYKNGDYAITNIEYLYKKDNYTLTILPTQGKISVLPPKRDYVIKFKNTKSTTIVKSYFNGNPINNSKMRKNADLVIEIKDVPTSGQLTIVCTGRNIEIENMKIINEDFVSIISDLPIKTVVKERVDNILFSSKYDIRKKRIEIRKLANGKDYLERKYIDLFLKLLEYINEV